MSSTVAKRKSDEEPDSGALKIVKEATDTQLLEKAARALNVAVYLPSEIWAEIGSHLSVFEAVNLQTTIYSSQMRGVPALVAQSIHLKIVKALKILRMGALNFELIYSAERLSDADMFNVLHLKHTIDIQRYARRTLTTQRREYILDYGDRLLWTCDLKPNVLALLRVKPNAEQSGTPSARLNSIRELFMFSTRCYNFFQTMFQRPFLTDIAVAGLDEKGEVVLEVINKTHCNQFCEAELSFGNNVHGLNSIFHKITINDGGEHAVFDIETIDIFSGKIFLEPGMPEYEQKMLDRKKCDLLYDYDY